jgi:hypothetical protein
MAKIDVANQTAPSTPSTGTTSIYVDSSDKKLKTKDDAGVVTDYSAPGSAITALTGDVTATGPGSAAASISSATVTGKVLTGLTPTSGDLAATDTILQAFNKLAARVDRAWFGDGRDGSVTISTNTTLVRDMYYANLTVDPGVILSTGGFRIFSQQDAEINGTVERNGNSAVANTAGAALPAGTVGSGSAGGAGGGAGAGSAGGNAATSLGGSGGTGGAGGAGAGGALGTATVLTAAQGGQEALASVNIGQEARVLGAATLVIGGAGGGGGGGGGVANSGGGGGGGAGVLVISAKNLTGSGSITAIGGNGGNAAGTNGGGGGAGGGGVVVLISENDTTATSLTVSVAAGAVGSGNGTGASGNPGSVGRIFRNRT